MLASVRPWTAPLRNVKRNTRQANAGRVEPRWRCDYRVLAEGFAVALLLVALLAKAPRIVHAERVNPPVQAGTPLEFPRDHGSHPGFKLEWWYVTGWLEDDDAAATSRSTSSRGFQVTFFRVRTGLGEDNPSAFAPRQVLF